MTHHKLSKSLKALQYDTSVDQRPHTVMFQHLGEWNGRNEPFDSGDLVRIL